jgi:hypothetical protein
VEKEIRAAELVIAKAELAFQKGEKTKRAAELVIAKVGLASQKGQEVIRAVDLVIVKRRKRNTCSRISHCERREI